MKGLYLECNAGISGDMAVAALLDVGADESALKEVLASVPADGFSTVISRVKKAGLDCCDFNVILDEGCENHDHDMEWLFGHDHIHGHDDGSCRHGESERASGETHRHDVADRHHHHHGAEAHQHGVAHRHEHRNLSDVVAIIAGTKMTDGARTLAIRIFEIVAEAEAKAHGVSVEEVHFHEVGALDSIVDVIAFAVCFDNLKTAHGIDRVFVPRLCEGTGSIRCQHGILPVPVPAVTNIAAAYALPLSFIEERGEFVTPTGAAFVAAVRTGGVLPAEFRILKTGLGAGKRTYRRPSVLRAFMIEESEATACGGGTVVKLEANIDDCSGEALGFAADLLMEAGARDVHFVPCFMKKGRPAYVLSVLCAENDVAKMEEIIFLNTTTIGIRRCSFKRTVLERDIVSVETEWGAAQVKTVEFGGRRFARPEYESVRRLCRESGRGFDEVYRAVEDAAQNRSRRD